MAGGTSGTVSGAVLGLVVGLLVQQFGYLNFSIDLIGALLYLLLIAAVFAVGFGVAGRTLKGRALRKARQGSGPEPPSSGRVATSAPPEAGPTPPAQPPTS
jgi:hypothetical protein